MIGTARQNEKHTLATALQKATAVAVGMTDERRAAKVGAFAKFANVPPEVHNLVGSNHSVGIIGKVNAFVCGEEHMTCSSMKDATVFGLEAAHLKSNYCAEVAAQKVKLTSEACVDVHSNGKLSLVAHSGGEKFADMVPDASAVAHNAAAFSIMAADDVSMLLHAEKGIKIDSTTGHVQTFAPAGKSITIANAGVEVMTNANMMVNAVGLVSIKGEKILLK